jgi:hypothetical protein
LPSRRKYIPKADGKQRPLGIAALEDKIVQAAVVAILTPIYEAEFLGFSYGFRPGRGQHDALDALAYGINARKINWIHVSFQQPTAYPESQINRILGLDLAGQTDRIAAWGVADDSHAHRPDFDLLGLFLAACREQQRDGDDKHSSFHLEITYLVCQVGSWVLRELPASEIRLAFSHFRTDCEKTDCEATRILRDTPHRIRGEGRLIR